MDLKYLGTFRLWISTGDVMDIWRSWNGDIDLDGHLEILWGYFESRMLKVWLLEREDCGMYAQQYHMDVLEHRIYIYTYVLYIHMKW